MRLKVKKRRKKENRWVLTKKKESGLTAGARANRESQEVLEISSLGRKTRSRKTQKKKKRRTPQTTHNV